MNSYGPSALMGVVGYPSLGHDDKIRLIESYASQHRYGDMRSVPVRSDDRREVRIMIPPYEGDESEVVSSLLFAFHDYCQACLYAYQQISQRFDFKMYWIPDEFGELNAGLMEMKRLQKRVQHYRYSDSRIDDDEVQQLRKKGINPKDFVRLVHEARVRLFSCVCNIYPASKGKELCDERIALNYPIDDPYFSFRPDNPYIGPLERNGDHSDLQHSLYEHLQHFGEHGRHGDMPSSEIEIQMDSHKIMRLCFGK
jgi:hypothetical protein